MGQIIHNISSPDDGLGDELRNAFDHQNQMNTELYDDKVDKINGKDLSTNDFTDALKTKLLGIATGAEVNVQSDWAQNDNTADDYIKNKPTLNNYVNTIGYFNYSNDDTTPLTLVADTEKKLECDCVGAYTNIDHPTHGVTRVFDPTTNNIVLDEFEVGDILLLRTDTIITTTTANQNYKIILRLGIGTANEFEIVILEEQVKTTGAHQKVITTNFTIDSEEVRLALGEIVILSDHAGSVVVNGFHFTGIKRNVNFVELSGGGAVSITGLISEGTNVTITGTGTLADPYVISSSGGSGTTPTLQEVTDVGNEIINTAGDLKLVLDKEYNGMFLYELVSGTWEFRAQYNNQGFSVGGFDGNVSIDVNYLTGLLTISQGSDVIQFSPISATKNGVEFATEDFALKRDGSNANADVDLGVTYGIKAGTVTIQNNGASKSMRLLASNLNNERTAEWQDMDYTGVADISQIPDVSGKEDTSNKSSSYTASSIITYPNTKALVDGLATKQDKMSWISSSSPYTGTTSTALQKLSNAGSSGNGSFTAKANTRYKIEIQFQLSGLSTTTNYVQFGILGTAGITSVNGQSIACKSATLISSNTPSYTALNTATISAALMTTGTQAFARAIINIEVVTSTAGTLIIAFATNVSTTPVVENHIIRFIELGASSTTASSDIV